MKRLLIPTFAIALTLTSFSPVAIAQSNPAATATRTGDQKKEYRLAMEDADQSIYNEIKAHSELMKNLEYLTSEIGPHLTGSQQMQAASAWTLKRFKDYGIAAHLETTQVAHAYLRGNDHAAITAPIARAIQVRSLGWSKATAGELRGNIIVLDPAADPASFKGKLKGAIVLAGEPAKIPTQEADNAYDAVIPPSHGVPRRDGKGANRFRLMGLLKDEGVGVVLLDSGKTDNLFNMGGISRDYNPSGFPIAFLTHEDYSLIYRLAKEQPVAMTVALQGTFSPTPENASITVAEIKGSEFPEERVIIGGHLDSWDLGQGALDNGTGAMATLEAARAFKALGLKPKRTLTFILFTGEEQGGIGADLFLKNHAAEVPKIDGVLIDDTGTGKVISIALEDLYETAPAMTEIYQPLAEVFAIDPLSTRYFGSSDHVPFLNKGVPAYFCIQTPAHYREAHHSQTDTFDKVLPDEVNQGAALLAAWAWNVSQYPTPLPHHPIPKKELD